ncbi:MAG TPA: hypothetical protein PKI20_19050, partial [Verrucomicrobiota bacterium]|nr:hypothetical protein [Verrucomicrobiota bacterium]HQL79876.1 hypothetical protein [Verrucomicrobiota bacterium]
MSKPELHELRRAAATLGATWQDQPLKHFREPEPTEEGAARALAEAATGDRTAGPQRAAVLPRGSWLTDPRPWDADPIRWRVERLGSVEGFTADSRKAVSLNAGWKER